MWQWSFKRILGGDSEFSIAFSSRRTCWASGEAGRQTDTGGLAFLPCQMIPLAGVFPEVRKEATRIVPAGAFALCALAALRGRARDVMVISELGRALYLLQSVEKEGVSGSSSTCIQDDEHPSLQQSSGQGDIRANSSSGC